MSAKWADMDSDSDDEIDEIPIQPAGLNDGTVQASGGMRWADSDSEEEEEAVVQEEEKN